MDKAQIKRVAKKALKEIEARPRKANRTLSLDDGLFLRFKAICEAQEVSTSSVLDELIKAYVGEFN